MLAHLDAHLADRTTVCVCDRAHKLGRKTEIGVLWIMSGIVHHRSSSSVVSPSLVYLARNQECSVQLDPAPSSSPLFPIIATAPSMTRDAGPRTGLIGLLTKQSRQGSVSASREILRVRGFNKGFTIGVTAGRRRARGDGNCDEGELLFFPFSPLSS